MAYKDNDISDLIPDYCNNRLNAKEKADFESRLKEDQEMLNECNDFKEFQKLYRQIDSGEPSPSDAIFERISRNVSDVHKVKPKVPARPGPLAESIRHYWQQIRESFTVPWMLAAAQTVVILLLLIPAPQQDTYSTLSTAEEGAIAEKIGINVVFRPNALESDIRTLLYGIQGSVSSGPSREGRYVVSIGSKSDLDKVMQTLKQSEIVIFAEPVY